MNTMARDFHFQAAFLEQNPLRGEKLNEATVATYNLQQKML